MLTIALGTCSWSFSAGRRNLRSFLLIEFGEQLA